MAEDIYGISGEDADRLRRMLEEFEGVRLRQAETLRKEQPEKRIEQYLARVTAEISAASTVSTTLTTLNGAVNNSVTSLIVHSVTGMPTDREFIITIGTEQILVTALETTYFRLTIVRGWNGTTAASHIDGSNVVLAVFTLGFGDVTIVQAVEDSAGDYGLMNGTESLTTDDDPDGFTAYNVSTSAITVGTLVKLLREPFSGLLLAINEGSGGSGITSINGDTTADQILDVGTDGTDFAIDDSVPGTHTFNLPDASSLNRGVVTIGFQEFGGLKYIIDGAYTDAAFGSIDPSGVYGNVGINWFDSHFPTILASGNVGGGGEDVNGNSVEVELSLRGGERDAGDTVWVTHTRVVLYGTSPGPNFDDKPAYCIYDGSSVLEGQTISVTLAKITGGGSNGSLTISGGIVTGYTAPT